MPSVAEALQDRLSEMTRAERQLADVILRNYPISGLGSITELATQADVSTPSVARLVQKLGFSGYPAFQAGLRAELGEMISDPISKRETWRHQLPQEHVLSRYAEAVEANMRMTLDHIDPEEFDAVSDLVSDHARKIFVSGGRLSGTIAKFLFLHLQMIRSDVILITSDASWPHAILDVNPGDVMLAFDVRRYENQTLVMGEMAHKRGAEIVLFTDQWRSPLHHLAKHTFAARISVPSAWDSGMGLMLLVESLIASVQETLWESVKSRTDELEQAFDQTRLFRKFT